MRVIDNSPPELVHDCRPRKEWSDLVEHYWWDDGSGAVKLKMINLSNRVLEVKFRAIINHHPNWITAGMCIDTFEYVF